MLDAVPPAALGRNCWAGIVFWASTMTTGFFLSACWWGPKLPACAGILGGAGASSLHTWPGVLLAAAPGFCNTPGAFQLAYVALTVAYNAEVLAPTRQRLILAGWPCAAYHQTALPQAAALAAGGVTVALQAITAHSLRTQWSGTHWLVGQTAAALLSVPGPASPGRSRHRHCQLGPPARHLAPLACLGWPGRSCLAAAHCQGLQRPADGLPAQLDRSAAAGGTPCQPLLKRLRCCCCQPHALLMLGANIATGLSLRAAALRHRGLCPNTEAVLPLVRRP